MSAFTPSTADVRRQIQDGSLSSGGIDGETFDRWLDGVKAESRLVGRLAECSGEAVIKSVELSTALVGQQIIVQAFERGAFDVNQLGDMTKWVGVLVAYGIGPAATSLYFQGVNAPVTLAKDLYVEFYAPERSDAGNA